MLRARDASEFGHRTETAHMAEIPVERRPRGRGPLLALLAVVALAALAWLLLSRRGGGGDPAPPPADTMVGAPDTLPVGPPPVQVPVDEPLPVDTTDARLPAPGIVGDDTSGRVPPDTGPPAPEGRLGNP